MQYFVNKRGKITELNDFSEPYFHNEVRSLQGEYLRVYGADVPWFEHFSMLHNTMESCLPAYRAYGYRQAWNYLVSIDKCHHRFAETITPQELLKIKTLLNPDNLPDKLLHLYP